ncbi:MAG: prolyl oligopeptidase family serine peptidase [Verrucomicrobia bacterium]|nr:prolyl oligopeptidase family serine peptidase [Verrucomicrobiota bacterium]
MPSSRLMAALALTTSLGLAPPPRPAGPNEPATPASIASRADALAHMRRLFPPSEPWEQWLRQSRELPPDFNLLPSTPFLPDPLRFADGGEARKEEWPRRRRELLVLIQHYLTGVAPPSPANGRPSTLQSREEPGAFIDEVTWAFGPGHAARLRFELILPKAPGPFPVFLTPSNHRAWALVAVSRGYLACVYAAAEPRDDTAAWTNVWPKADWTTLRRHAWAASRGVDYVSKLPVANTNQMALAGHGRDGAAALVAAATDPRIGAVIASSSGAGGACPWRLFSEARFGEGIEAVTRAFPGWLHPRLRFFAGRESKLPFDQSGLVACIAPRPCLICSAVNDGKESLWAIEHSHRSARRAYALLGKPGQLYLRYRPGGHETSSEDIEGCLDWLDAVFGRAPFTFPDVTTFPTYDLWEKTSRDKVDPMAFRTNEPAALLETTNRTRITTPLQWMQHRHDIRQRLLWSLGEAPPFAESSAGFCDDEPAPRALLLGRHHVPPGLAKRSLHFGNALAGDLYFPTRADTSGRRLPAVIWLHPVPVATGYVPGCRDGEPPHLALARRGLAVLAFDQIGSGARVEEIRHFYFRYPRWSLLGKMVEDVLAGAEALRKLPFIDAGKIGLLGYATGGMVALHAGALDDRIAAVVSVAGITPMRLDTAAKGTGGIARVSRWLPLQPRLGAFVTHETRIPYDYHEVLAMIAPRPVWLFAPRLDACATPADVQACVDEARSVFALLKAKAHLRLDVLDDYNRFPPETQQVVCDALAALLRR